MAQRQAMVTCAVLAGRGVRIMLRATKGALSILEENSLIDVGMYGFRREKRKREREREVISRV
jgi:hypothetical protein